MGKFAVPVDTRSIGEVNSISVPRGQEFRTLVRVTKIGSSVVPERLKQG